MKTENPSLDLSEAIKLFSINRQLRDKHGTIWYRPMDHHATRSIDEFISSAPFTIVEDSPKDPELPEYLDSICDKFTTLHKPNMQEFCSAILRAVDERIATMERNHICDWHTDRSFETKVNELIAKAIDELKSKLVKLVKVDKNGDRWGYRE